MQTSDMFLVYRDHDNKVHWQHWSDLVQSGTLVDPDTGDDLEVIGWTTQEGGNCPNCYSWDDNLEYRDGICEDCYLDSPESTD